MRCHVSIRTAVTLVFLQLAVPACGTTHYARPLNTGENRISLSAGGPLVRFAGAPVPIPITSVEVARGVGSGVDVHAGLHPFAFALNPPDSGSIPVLGADLGFVWHPIPIARSALSLGASLYGFTNRADAILFSDFWLSTGGRPLRWLFLAAGFHNYVRIGTSDRDIQERPIWAPMAFTQVAFRPIGWRVELDIELRWYAFNYNSHITAVNYYPIGTLGALGLVFGVHYHFGG